jgi:hypothetical protein
MPRTSAPTNAHRSHYIVDGSNIATEGRATPSLKQLNEAVIAFIEERPDVLVTVVVDATFGHRIDKKEVKAFDEAVANNELVTPPAGAVGRGDAFVLSIANKAKAGILSNDSFQEFHGDYAWLFEPGRLIGGKPVPHVGWVFVERLPVRGPKSRQAVKDAKHPPRASSRARGTGSPLADQPLPVPTAPPPGPPAVAGKAKRQAAEAVVALAASAAGDGAQQAARATVNELLPFLEFVERHPVGTGCTVVVESYASHGAYARADDVLVYVPLRLMGDPPPRSARAALKIGEAVAVVVVGYVPERRSIDAALVSAGEVAVKAQAPAPGTPELTETLLPARRRSRAKQITDAPAAEQPPPAEPAAETPGKRRRAAKQVAADSAPASEQPGSPPETAAAVPTEPSEPKARRTRRKPEPEPAAVPEPEPQPKQTRKRAAKQPAERAAKQPAKQAAKQPAKQPAKQTEATPAASSPSKRASRAAKAAPPPAVAEQPKSPRKRAAKPKAEKPGS